MQSIYSVFFSSTNIALLCLICLFIFAGCSSIVASTKDIKDPLALQSNPTPVFDPVLTAIGMPYQNKLKQNPTITGGMLVSDGLDAFLHRAYLARMAEKSIVLQTYIYKNDLASRILMHEIWLAAQRGVIVKMLIDDNGLDSDFSDIIALNSHPNIEVKIFNPYKNRSKILRYPEMVFDFNRINHRMHNKLFIVDDIALIIGGRNIADNYFDQNHHINFVDTDVLFIGNVAMEGKKNFYEYWNFHRSIPVSLLKFKTPLKKVLKRILSGHIMRKKSIPLLKNTKTNLLRYFGATPCLLLINQKKFKTHKRQNPLPKHLQRFSTLHITIFIFLPPILCQAKRV